MAVSSIVFALGAFVISCGYGIYVQTVKDSHFRSLGLLLTVFTLVMLAIVYNSALDLAEMINELKTLTSDTLCLIP